MKNIIKLIFFAFVITIQAQEFSIYLSGGKSGLKYSDIESSKLKYGGNIGFGYAYNIDRNWSIITGLEVGINGNKFILDDIEKNRYEVDAKKSTFDYRIKIDSYEESSSFTSINIPLMLQYKLDLELPMYINLGCKIIFPMEQNINIKANNVQLNGYYPDFNLLVDDLPQHGFGKIRKLNTNSKNDLKPIVLALSGSFGFILKNNDKAKFYIGPYFDYGFTEVRMKEYLDKKSSKDLFIDYSPKGLDKAKLNNSTSIFHSDFASMLSYGIHLKYVIFFGSIKPRNYNKCFGNNGLFR